MLAFLAAVAASAAQLAPGLPARLREVSMRLDTIRIEVNEGRRTLWRGSLRVNRASSAYHRESLMNAVAPACATISTGLAERDELTVELRKWGGNATDPDEYGFTIQIERTRIGEDCERHQQLFTIGRNARLARHQSIELRGDGQLWAVISRP
jgi:hypothetical protein